MDRGYERGLVREGHTYIEIERKKYERDTHTHTHTHIEIVWERWGEREK